MTKTKAKIILSLLAIGITGMATSHYIELPGVIIGISAFCLFAGLLALIESHAED